METRALDLSHRDLTDDDVAAIEIGPDIGRIDLSHNRIGNAGIKTLAEKLKDVKQRLFVNVSHNDIGDIGFIHIAKVSRIKLDFDASYNKLTLEGYKRFITELNMGFRIGGRIMDEGNPFWIENSQTKLAWVTIVAGFRGAFGCGSTQHLD